MKPRALAPLLVALAACSGAPHKSTLPPSASPASSKPDRATQANQPRRSPYAPAQEDPSKRGNYTRGGLYAPEISDSAPSGLPDVDLIPEPEVRDEPHSRYGNRSPYVVLGKTYDVLPNAAGYDEVGLASFYGNKFHGRRTSNLEVYDMYAFTAAHKTLPLPSFARVTNLANGKSVIVRINDRGPFHDGRIIDLSYAAAVKLGVDRAGTARVEVRGLTADDARADDGVIASAPPPQLPSGVRVANGRPSLPAASAATVASAMDELVAAIPPISPSALPPAQQSEQPATATLNPNREWRFDMRQDGKAMTADQFDAWMKTRRVRVATGKPGTPDPVAVEVAMDQAGANPSSAGAATAPVVAAAAPPPPAPVTAAALVAASTPAAGAVVLQVAAFGNPQNAHHALAMLRDAGIADARLLDGTSNGQKVWRLRIGPVDAARAPELALRVVGLGFGQPQRVRE